MYLIMFRDGWYIILTEYKYLSMIRDEIGGLVNFAKKCTNFDDGVHYDSYTIKVSDNSKIVAEYSDRNVITIDDDYTVSNVIPLYLYHLKYTDMVVEWVSCIGMLSDNADLLQYSYLPRVGVFYSVKRGKLTHFIDKMKGGLEAGVYKLDFENGLIIKLFDILTEKLKYDDV